MGWEGAGRWGWGGEGLGLSDRPSTLPPSSSPSTLWTPGFLRYRNQLDCECLAFQVSLGEMGWLGKGLGGQDPEICWCWRENTRAIQCPHLPGKETEAPRGRVTHPVCPAPGRGEQDSDPCGPRTCVLRGYFTRTRGLKKGRVEGGGGGSGTG